MTRKSLLVSALILFVLISTACGTQAPGIETSDSSGQGPIQKIGEGEGEVAIVA